MEAALYDPAEGFFATGQGARRDFVTSPELGSLFGTCVARALDEYWRALDEPDPFLVVEAGAGNGRLASDVLRAAPACGPALRYVLVERSASLRVEQRTRLPVEPADEALGPFMSRAGEDAPVPMPGAGPVVAALDELPAVEANGAVLIANELLDNLPFGIAQFDGERWYEVRIGADGSQYVEVLVPCDPPGMQVAAGTRVPIPRGLRGWFEQCERTIGRGFVVLIDYMTDEPELRLRTYISHARGTSPLDAPGSQDVTADVVIDQLGAAAAGFTVENETTQAEWLRDLGIEALAAAGVQRWEDGAHRGDLDALTGRSHAHEAAALTDAGGLGAHRVVVLRR
jgi:SAM-dependent MidA family methyltransferase